MIWVTGYDLAAFIGEDKLVVLEMKNKKITGYAKIVQRKNIKTDDEGLKQALQENPLYLAVDAEDVLKL